MKFEVHTMFTQREIDAARAFFERNGYKIPEGMADDVRQTGSKSPTFYVIGKDALDDLIGVGKVVPNDVQSGLFDAVKIEAIYLDDDVQDLGTRRQFIKGALKCCDHRWLDPVLTDKQMAYLARRMKGMAVMTTQSEVDEARAFLERNHFEIPQGMADDVRQTEPTSQTFYVMAKNTDGGICCVAKVSPYDIGAGPGGPVKIENVYLAENREVRLRYRQFIEGIWHICSDRKASGIVIDGDSMPY